jgi:hypothetical protein
MTPPGAGKASVRPSPNKTSPWLHGTERERQPGKRDGDNIIAVACLP